MFGIGTRWSEFPDECTRGVPLHGPLSRTLRASAAHVLPGSGGAGGEPRVELHREYGRPQWPAVPGAPLRPDGSEVTESAQAHSYI